MNRFNAQFDLHGIRVHISASSQGILQEVTDIIINAGGDPKQDSRKSNITLRFQPGSLPSAPAAARLIKPREDAYPALSKSADVYFAVHSEVAARIEPCEQQAEIVFRKNTSVLSGPNRLVFLYCTLSALGIMLHYRGWYGIHAACLAQNDRGAMFVAPSDSGKSTLSFNLVRQGWDYISDDSLLLHAHNDESIEAFSFRRPLCIDADAGANFSELANRNWPSMLSDENKWRVDIESLYPDRIAPKCTPRVLVYPTIEKVPQSRLTPTDAKSMLRILLTQTMIMGIPNPQVAQQQLDVLRTLLRQTDTYRLEAGRDALDTPEVLDQLLAPTLD